MSDTVRPTSHMTYNVGLLQFTPMSQYQGSSRIASIGSVWFQFYNTFMGCICYMLTVIYIYFNFTIISITYLSVFAMTRHVDDIDWVLLSWVIG